MTTVSGSGRARKSLASQIDRLDAILDGLAQNLGAAVATAGAGAVKEAMAVAVRETVHAAVLEALTQRELQQRLGVTHAPARQPPPPVAVRLADTARQCWGWLAGAARDTWDTVTTVAQKVKPRVLEAANHFLATGRAKVREFRDQVTARVRAGAMRLLLLAALARQLRLRLLVSLGVGVVVGLAAYLAGPLLVPVACGLAGSVVSLLAGAWEPFRRGAATPEARGG
jgi:hypothetical protein